MSSTHVLGQIVAENDSESLDSVFFPSKEYHFAKESNFGGIVVGRRGTGKSAIFYKLKQETEGLKNTLLVARSPTEEDMLMLRASLKNRSQNYKISRVIIKICWKYAILMQLAKAISSHYKIKTSENAIQLAKFSAAWYAYGQNDCTQIAVFLETFPAENKEESLITLLNSKLQISRVQDLISAIMGKFSGSVLCITDRIDEGYIPDETGLALIAGIVNGTTEINHTLPKVKIIVFCRDNIFRALSKNDDDFTRNIEGQEIRLNWNESTLLDLVSRRISKYIFDLKVPPLEAWSKFVSPELHGKDGFRECLRNTLYRPRDIISLLNQAYNVSLAKGLDRIDRASIAAVSTDISSVRLADLIKEYGAIIPCLSALVKGFANSPSKLNYSDIERIVNVVKISTSDAAAMRDFDIFPLAIDIIQVLYTVGFIGWYNESQGSYIFCHDGKSIKSIVSPSTILLIHPCYWAALKIDDSRMSEAETKTIDDEYRIEIAEIGNAERDRFIGSLVSRIGLIEEGQKDASKFEEWCRDVINFGLKGHLKNVELHPNKNNTSRRDVVGTTMIDAGLGQRLSTDYGTRQLVFEVKNYVQPTINDYRQLQSYLTGHYGKIGILITRAEDDSLRKAGGELDWYKEALKDNKKILKLSARVIAKHLGKMRRGPAIDSLANYIESTIDRYDRVY